MGLFCDPYFFRFAHPVKIGPAFKLVSALNNTLSGKMETRRQLFGSWEFEARACCAVLGARRRSRKRAVDPLMKRKALLSLCPLASRAAMAIPFLLAHHGYFGLVAWFRFLLCRHFPLLSAGVLSARHRLRKPFERQAGWLT